MNERTILVRSALADSKTVEVAVIDNGSGVPNDQAPLVFEPFHSSKPQGLGMGLSISRTIVEAHGGRIWMTPNSSAGTTFRFTLPVACEA